MTAVWGSGQALAEDLPAGRRYSQARLEANPNLPHSSALLFGRRGHVGQRRRSSSWPWPPRANPAIQFRCKLTHSVSIFDLHDALSASADFICFLDLEKSGRLSP